MLNIEPARPGTILITGATGLVGARLLPRLIEAGDNCRMLTRGANQAPAGASATSGDLLDPASLETAVRGVTTIIHLAAVFRTPDADSIWKCNLEGTRNLIAAAKAHAPGARFIMASTSHVYDADTPWPGRETDTCYPTLDYPASKLAAEKELRASGLNWSVLRLGFVYGDGDGHMAALPKLAAKAKLHPAQRLSLVHHRDIAAAIRLALSGAFDHRIVNITDEAPSSIYELALIVGEAMTSSEEPLSNPWHLHMDGTLARHLGFRPAVRTVYQALQEGLM